MCKVIFKKIAEFSDRYSPLLLAIVALIAVVSALLESEQMAIQNAIFGLLALIASYVALINKTIEAHLNEEHA